LILLAEDRMPYRRDALVPLKRVVVRLIAYSKCTPRIEVCQVRKLILDIIFSVVIIRNENEWEM